MLGPATNSHPTSNAVAQPSWPTTQQPGHPGLSIANGPSSQPRTATNTTTPPHPTAPNSRPVEPVGPHPNLHHPGSAFTSVPPSHAPASAVPHPAGVPPSHATHPMGGSPAPAPFNTPGLGSGQPPRPMMNTAGGAGTPSSSGPPTPSHTPSPGQEGHTGRPMASRRRQYPAQVNFFSVIITEESKASTAWHLCLNKVHSIVCF